MDDNFHYIVEDQRYELGAFAGLEAAIAAAKAVVDDYLEAACKPGMTAHELFESYTMFGEDPFILGPDQPYADHPVHQFVRHAIPVTLNTDDPVRVWTTIGREYAIGAALGLTAEELLSFTRNAIQAAFVSPIRRAALLQELDAWEAGQAHGI